MTIDRQTDKMESSNKKRVTSRLGVSAILSVFSVCVVTLMHVILPLYKYNYCFDDNVCIVVVFTNVFPFQEKAIYL